MNKDSVIFGLIVGTLLPLAAYGILLTIMDGLDTAGILYKDQLAGDFRTRTLSLVAIGFNIFPMQYFYKNHATNSMRGMVFPTLIFCGIWVYKFLDLLF